MHGGKKYDLRTFVKEQKYDQRIMLCGNGVVYGKSMSMETPNDVLKAWLVNGLAKDGKSNTELARLLGIPQPRVAEMKSGKRLIKTSEVAIISDYIGEPVPAEIAPQQSTRQVPVVGYVGAGAQIFTIDDHHKGAGLEEVEAPPGSNSTSVVALRVRGTSMIPVYKDGDLIFYDKREDGDIGHLVGKDCVIQLEDGSTYLKELRRANGDFWLHSHNADPILRPEIVWAARVRWVEKA
jgi:phage repressor protein C with HTH and peptisase S24 domain